MNNSELATGITGIILGAGLTIILAMAIWSLARVINRKRKAPHKSQYFMYNQDGTKIPIEDDDGED